LSSELQSNLENFHSANLIHLTYELYYQAPQRHHCHCCCPM